MRRLCPLALLANYAMHGTVLGANSTVVSADARGVLPLAVLASAALR